MTGRPPAPFVVATLAADTFGYVAAHLVLGRLGLAGPGSTVAAYLTISVEPLLAAVFLLVFAEHYAGARNWPGHRRAHLTHHPGQRHGTPSHLASGQAARGAGQDERQPMIDLVWSSTYG